MRRSAHPTHPEKSRRSARVAMNPLLRHDERSYRGHGPLLPPRPCSSVGAGHALDGGPARPLAATGYAGCRSGRGCVPTLERGNDKKKPATKLAVFHGAQPTSTRNRLLSSMAHCAPGDHRHHQRKRAPRASPRHPSNLNNCSLSRQPTNNDTCRQGS